MEFNQEVRRAVACLADPRHFGGHPCAVEVIETHFAWVFLVGSRAFKLKKRVYRGVMDYRTVASRKRACRAELRLNRRLAPRVYVRVVALRRARDGSLSCAGGARIVDWLIEMRKLPRERALDWLITASAIGPRDLGRIVARLAAFFELARPRPMTRRGYLSRLRRQIDDNARELYARELGLNHRQVAELAQAQLRFLSENPGLFAGRGARLRDGHGDLRPEHVFLAGRSSEVCVIDCLEFDADLRRLDPAEEIAFLALECARLGRPWIGETLIAEYRRILRDPVPQALMQFYLCRRAAVRAQVTAWHLCDESFAGERRVWRARANSYLADALRFIRCASARAPACVRNGAVPASVPQ